jgi:hypothetical protein
MPDYKTAVASFGYIYDNNVWGNGSGNSSPDETRPYMQLLTEFIRDKGIRTVVDVGCGDWQHSRAIDWSGVRYFGFDVVESVIETNRRNFGAANIQFDVLRRTLVELPSADLVLCKDVLQHLPTADVNEYLDWFQAHYKYAIVTNDISCVSAQADATDDPTGYANIEIEHGAYRPIRLDLPPFDRKVVSLLEWQIESPVYKWIKRSCLLIS